MPISSITNRSTFGQWKDITNEIVSYINNGDSYYSVNSSGIWTSVNVVPTTTGISLGTPENKFSSIYIGELGADDFVVNTSGIYANTGIFPLANNTYDIGDPENRFQEIYTTHLVSNSSMVLISNDILPRYASVSLGSETNDFSRIHSSYLTSNSTGLYTSYFQSNTTSFTTKVDIEPDGDGLTDIGNDGKGFNSLFLSNASTIWINDTTQFITYHNPTDSIYIGTGTNGLFVNADYVVSTAPNTYLSGNSVYIEGKALRLNAGGGVDSGAYAGVEIIENDVITGWIAVSEDRNYWEVAAPNSDGVFYIVPPASGSTTLSLPSGGSGDGGGTGDPTEQDYESEPVSIGGYQLNQSLNKNSNVIFKSLQIFVPNTTNYPSTASPKPEANVVYFKVDTSGFLVNVNATIVGGSHTITGNTSIPNLTGGSVNVNSLRVAGATTACGAITAASLSTSGTGNITSAGNITASKKGTFGDTVTISDGGLDVTGNVEINVDGGTVNIYGGDVSISTVDGIGNVSIDGYLVLTQPITIPASTDGTPTVFEGDVFMEQDLDVAGLTNTNTLEVVSTSEFGGAITTTSTMTVGGKLTVSSGGIESTGGNIIATGGGKLQTGTGGLTATSGKISARDASFSANVKITDTSVSAFTVSGNSTFNKFVKITDAATVNTTTGNGALMVEGGVKVTGDMVLEGNFIGSTTLVLDVPEGEVAAAYGSSDPAAAPFTISSAGAPTFTAPAVGGGGTRKTTARIDPATGAGSFLFFKAVDEDNDVDGIVGVNDGHLYFGQDANTTYFYGNSTYLELQVEESFTINATSIAIEPETTFGDSVTITGNLTVLGTQVTINTTSLAVEDQIIALNHGAIDSGTTLVGDAGLIIENAEDVGLSAAFVYDQSEDRWCLAYTNSNHTDTTININRFTNLHAGIIMSEGFKANGTSTFQTILPAADITYDLGSPTKRFKDLYLSGTTLVIGDTSISSETGTVSIDGNFRTAGDTSFDGGITVNGIGVFTNTISVTGDATLSSNLAVIGATTLSNTMSIVGDLILSSNAIISGVVGTGETEALIIPVGTELQRPGTPESGMIRFNSDSSSFEGYIGTTWAGLGGVVDSANDGDTFLSIYGANTATATSSSGDDDSTENMMRFWVGNTAGISVEALRIDRRDLDNGYILDPDYSTTEVYGFFRVPVNDETGPVDTGSNGNGVPGMIRFDPSRGFEGYLSSNTWAGLGGAVDSANDGDTFISVYGANSASATSSSGDDDSTENMMRFWVGNTSGVSSEALRIDRRDSDTVSGTPFTLDSQYPTTEVYGYLRIPVVGETAEDADIDSANGVPGMIRYSPSNGFQGKLSNGLWSTLGPGSATYNVSQSLNLEGDIINSNTVVSNGLTVNGSITSGSTVTVEGGNTTFTSDSVSNSTITLNTVELFEANNSTLNFNNTAITANVIQSFSISSSNNDTYTVKYLYGDITTTGNINLLPTATLVGEDIISNTIYLSSNTSAVSPNTGTLVVEGGVLIKDNLIVEDIITETSSIKYKTDVNSINNFDVDDFLSLNPVTYTRKSNGNKEVGLIAEDVYLKFPTVVTKDSFGDVNGIQYTRLIPYMIKMIQKQQEQIKELTTKLEN